MNLEILCNSLGHKIIYNPKKYHGAYLVIQDRKVTIYKSGKYIITGLKQIEDAKRFYSLLKSELESILDISLFWPPIIQNIVMTETLDSPVNILSILEQHPDLLCEPTLGSNKCYEIVKKYKHLNMKG